MEMVATQMWTYGYALNMNKLTMRSITGKDPVNHLYQPIVLSGHNCGPMIPDVTLPVPSNQWYPVMWPLSERKITFSASTVKMNGKATGCAQTFGIPPIPMMTCGEPVSAPTARMMAPQLVNSVTVGLTWADLAKGLVSIAASMAIDLLIFKKFDGGSLKQWAKGFSRTAREASEEAWEKVAKDLGGATARRLRSALDGELGEAGERLAKFWLGKRAGGKMGRKIVNKHVVPTEKKGWAKKALSSASDFAISGLFDEQAEAKFEVGGPFASATASGEVEFAPEQGEEVVQEEKGQGRVLGWEGEAMPGPDE